MEYSSNLEHTTIENTIENINVAGEADQHNQQIENVNVIEEVGQNNVLLEYFGNNHA